jgi:hypothetical protein
MEEDLKFFFNGRQLHFWEMEDNLFIFRQWKMTSISFLNGRQPQVFKCRRRPYFFLLGEGFNFFKIEDELNFFENGSRTQFLWKPTLILLKSKMTSISLKMEDYFKPQMKHLKLEQWLWQRSR